MTAGHDLLNAIRSDSRTCRATIYNDDTTTTTSATTATAASTTRPCLLHSEPTLTNTIHSQRFQTATAAHSRVAYQRKVPATTPRKSRAGEGWGPLFPERTSNITRPWTGRDFQGWELR